MFISASHAEIKQDLHVTLFDLICKRAKLIHFKSMQCITPATSDPLKAAGGFCSDLCVINKMEKRSSQTVMQGQLSSRQVWPLKEVHSTLQSWELPPPVVLINIKKENKAS